MYTSPSKKQDKLKLSRRIIPTALSSPSPAELSSPPGQSHTHSLPPLHAIPFRNIIRPYKVKISLGFGRTAMEQMKSNHPVNGYIYMNAPSPQDTYCQCLGRYIHVYYISKAGAVSQQHDPSDARSTTELYFNCPYDTFNPIHPIQ